MNFLQLCQDVVRESGTVSGDGTPTTVTDQTGRLLKIVNWTAQAWVDIQNLHPEWNFLRQEYEVQLTPDYSRYLGTTAISNFGSWIIRDGLISLYDSDIGTSDESTLKQIAYDVWKRHFDQGDQTSDRPRYVAVSPANELCFGPVPDKDYIVRGPYFRAPQVLAANTDTPICNSKWHKIIVWHALEYLAKFDEGDFSVQRSQQDYARMLTAMEAAELPPITLSCQSLA